MRGTTVVVDVGGVGRGDARHILHVAATIVGTVGGEAGIVEDFTLGGSGEHFVITFGTSTDEATAHLHIGAVEHMAVHAAAEDGAAHVGSVTEGDDGVVAIGEVRYMRGA